MSHRAHRVAERGEPRDHRQARVQMTDLGCGPVVRGGIVPR